MRLVLTNGYPYPYPAGLSEAEQEEINSELRTLEFVDVAHFEWVHTITVEFKDWAAYEAARRMTGWKYWSECVLEVPVSGPDGYGHPAIIAGDKAYCGFMLLGDK